MRGVLSRNLIFHRIGLCVAQHNPSALFPLLYLHFESPSWSWTCCLAGNKIIPVMMMIMISIIPQHNTILLAHIYTCMHVYYIILHFPFHLISRSWELFQLWKHDVNTSRHESHAIMLCMMHSIFSFFSEMDGWIEINLTLKKFSRWSCGNDENEQSEAKG